MDPITFEVSGPVAAITLNRPAKRNAVIAQMAQLIETAIDRIESDDAIRVGIVRAEYLEGSRRVFCAGHDLSGEPGGSVTARGGFAGITRRQRRKPLIAAVDGLATGGGCEIVLACDIVVGSERTAFALAEVKWNLFAGGGGIFRLAQVVGRVVATDMVITGEELSGTRAYALGLISRFTSPGNVDEVARDVAKAIAANGPLSVQLSRAAAAAADSQDEETAWRMSESYLKEVLETHDVQEGMLAFNERRVPKFRGR
jgi:enoyl-CoA hydratase